MSNPCFVVTGYNNTRIYDIAKLRDLCHSAYRARLVLVTEQAKPQDHDAADVVLVAPLGAVESAEAVRPVAAELGRRGLRPIGVLPFSDRGVPLGAWLARHFALPGAEPHEAEAGLDKRHYRGLEAAAATHPDGFRPLLSLPARTLGEFEAAVARLGGTAFAKPANEGNSRGCQVVPDLARCPEIWAGLAPYHDSGVMVETLVRDAREYSWDFVGGTRWLTEKTTTQDRFRAEVQQIVPAPLEPDRAADLDRAGEHVRQLVSPGNGAFHNELFLREEGVSAVETNMRPGGMHIWDLARLSFEDFDPWRAWLHWAVTGEFRPARPEPRAFSGIRMLRAPGDGVLAALPDVRALADSLDIPLHRAAFAVSPADRVSADVTDNAGFVGHIVLTADDAKTLVDRLDGLASAIEARIALQDR
ncbi:hypothetical protein ACIRD3_30435 [Kitasatospora sp. NPDC093550]|uniref:hypothetical protein n=1 Tax=Kitasatospora sp. NPDC093550 TaxID=3364089 RepID=UPI0037F443E5